MVLDKKIIHINWGLLEFFREKNILTREAIKCIIGHEVGHAVIRKRTKEEKDRLKNLESDYNTKEYIIYFKLLEEELIVNLICKF